MSGSATFSTTYFYTGSVEDVSIPVSGIYEITADGAQGGDPSGGLGATVSGDIYLTAGTTLELIVGGRGGSDVAGGGGGGSFVIETTGGVVTILAVAGGGGGGVAGRTNGSGDGGETTPTGGNGGGASGGLGGALGRGGAGGGSVVGGGGGGGGLFGKGGNAAIDGAGGGGGGSILGSGGAGGSAGSIGSDGSGGYGGGGGGGGLFLSPAGGGGGGYGGGGGGGSGGGGGGGGSFDADLTNATATAGTQSGNGEVIITYEAACYYPGTRIGTPAGEVPVEDLHIGDAVLTADGDARPVRWIGRNTVSTRFGDPLRILPIRIKAGALGDGLPARDLLVSPDHAVLVEDVLIQAGALVNGISVIRESQVPETFTYYHVELAAHALLLAEGTPAETFVDNIDRMAFDNWAEHEALYGAAPIAEMPYARVKAARQLPARLRQKMQARARILLASGAVPPAQDHHAAA